MSESHAWRVVDELFHAALDRPPAERDAFLDAACRGDAALRGEVSSLLAADQRASDEALGSVTACLAADWIAEREASLPSGRMLARYRITGLVGRGGMGEVYRAQDTSLHRPIALKLLQRHFLADRERTRRFEAEARAASALNHPNIVTIHEIGRSNGYDYIVSEFVDGVTLRNRLAAGPLPLAMLLDIGIQTASALSVAHAAGIVHRDIKADNLMLRPDGLVKIVDFGIAKLAEQAQPEGRQTWQPPVATTGGSVVGTVCYMSPEQALGEAVDHRSDIFSLGVVLYEMATGRLPFEGNSDAAVYDALLHGTPAPVSAANPSLPLDLSRVIDRAIDRDRERRYQTASDLAAELKDLQHQSAGVPSPSARGGAVPARKPSNAGQRRTLARASMAAAAVAGLVAAGMWIASSGDRVVPTSPPVRRFVLTLPSIIEPEQVPGATAVISPDGRRLVYVRGPAARRSLYIRDLDRLDDRPLPGTEWGHTPFFSPDSRSVAFVARGELRKVSLAGGPPHRLAAVPRQRGASWGPDGRIVVATSDGRLRRLSADGGEAAVIATPDPGRGELAYRWPEVLPDGRAVIFTVIEGSDDQPTGGVHLRALSLDTGATRRVVAGASYGRYATSGHLLYHRAGSLEAVPFDARRLEVTGDAVPVAERVVGMPPGLAPEGAANFSVSNDGTLIYMPGTTGPIERSIFWVDRNGTEKALAPPRRALVDPSLSPDGRRLAIVANGTLFVVSLPSATWTRITPQSEMVMAPVWTRDGAHLVYARRTGERNAALFRRAADGEGGEELVWSDPEGSAYPVSFTPDGGVLAMMRMPSGSVQSDIWALHMRSSPPEARPVAATGANEQHPQFSPDGHWLAFVSDQSGRDEVYVQRFPAPTGTRQMSVDGGAEPRWSRNGRTLLFRDGDRMMEVPVQVGQPPRLVFEGAYQDVGAVLDYEVAADGERFLMLKGSHADAGYMHLHVVLNWFEELRRRSPVPQSQLSPSDGR